MDLTGRGYYVVFYPRKPKDEAYLRALFLRLPLSIPGDASIGERTKVTNRVMFRIKKASWVRYFADEYGVKYARPQFDDEEEVDAARPSLARPASLPVGRAAVGGEAKMNEQTGAAVLPPSCTHSPASKTRSRSTSNSDSSGSGVGQRTCEGWDSCDMPAAAGSRFCDECSDRCAVELSLSRSSTSTSMHVDLTGDHEMDVDDAGDDAGSDAAAGGHAGATIGVIGVGTGTGREYDYWPSPDELLSIKSAKWFWRWAFLLGKKLARQLLFGLRMADGRAITGSAGRETGRSIYTSSIRFRDELMRFLCHAGYSTYFYRYRRRGQRVNSVDGRVIRARHDGWSIDYHDNNIEEVLQCKRDVTASQYDGTVYCVTVPNHLVFAQRVQAVENGRIISVSRTTITGQCRRDDLESIGYMLMYFLNGKLPWQGLKARTKQEKYDKISNKKMNISIDTLCKNVPQQFAVYLTYTRNLRFIQKPDYKYLRGLFYDLFRQQGFKDDCIYDWMLKQQQQQQQQKKPPAAAAAAAAGAVMTPSNRSKPVSGAISSQQAIWDLTPGPQNQMLLNTAAAQKKAEEASDGEDEEDDGDDDGASQERIDEKADEQPATSNQQQQPAYWSHPQMQTQQQQQQPFLQQLSSSSPTSRPFQQTVPNLHVQTSSSYHTMQSPPPVPLPQMPYGNAQYIHPTSVPNRPSFPASNSTQPFLNNKPVSSSPIVVRQYIYGSARAEDETGEQPPPYSATFPNGSPPPQTFNNQAGQSELIERLEQSESEKKDLRKRVVELEKQLDRFRQENTQLKRHVQQQQQQSKPYSPVPQTSVAFSPAGANTHQQQLINAANTFTAQQQALQRSSLQLTQITQQIRDQFILQQQQQQQVAHQQQQAVAHQAQQAQQALSSVLAGNKRKYAVAGGLQSAADMQRVATPRSSGQSGTPSPLGDEDEPSSKRRTAQHVY